MAFLPLKLNLTSISSAASLVVAAITVITFIEKKEIPVDDKNNKENSLDPSSENTRDTFYIEPKEGRNPKVGKMVNKVDLTTKTKKIKDTPKPDYINRSIINSPETNEIAVIIVDANNMIQNYWSSKIARLYSEAGAKGVVGLFYQSILNTNKFSDLRSGNHNTIEILKLIDHIDYLAIGDINYTFKSGKSDNKLIVCTANITMDIISIQHSKLLDSFNITINGNGVSERQAREECDNKIYNFYRSNYSTINDL